MVLTALAVWVIAAFASIPSIAVAQDRGGYVIESFDTDLTVMANSDMVVEERIVVSFSEPRHGIYRTIPVRYSDPRGFAYSLDFRLLGVTNGSGRDYQTQVSNEGRLVNVRIGDPDRTVEGRVIYVLRYRVRNALSPFGEFDEIYWNATGHEWNASISRATAVVRLPAAVPVEDVTAAGYTGLAGSTEQAVEITHPEPGVVQFQATGAFDPREGLTVAVGFPKEVVTFPSAAQMAGRMAADNWVALLPLAWLGFLFRRYRRHGRDPDPDASIMVTYEPPPGLSPGGVGTLIDERVDLVDITATVVDLAVKRHLTIVSEARDRLFGILKREETVFRREPEAGQPPLAPHERLVMNALFEGVDEVSVSELENRFYTHLPGIRQALYEKLTSGGYFEGSPEKVRNLWNALGVGAALVTGMVAGGWLALRGVGPPAVPLIPLVTGGVTLLLFISFSSAMPRRTRKGVAAQRWALGFQEFAQRVEGERLREAASDPRHEFEALLPYAMALGVAKEWARKYEGIYARSSPDWYVGRSQGAGFATQSFERSLSSAMARTGTTMSSSPRSSSGSGGGGSSGGGGGGGGGGSW